MMGLTYGGGGTYIERRGRNRSVESGEVGVMSLDTFL